MTVRGGGVPLNPWLSCRCEEWVRRLGASLLMRMSASWSGPSRPTEYKVAARLLAPESELPSDRHPDRIERAIVLGAVKVWPGSVETWRKVGATANLDSPCARQRAEFAGRGGETGFQVEQRNWDESGRRKKANAANLALDFPSPIQGLLSGVKAPNSRTASTAASMN